MSVSSRLFEAFDTIGFSAGSDLNLYGSGFSINGVPIDVVAPDQPYLVDQREVTVAGFLDDGTPFSFYLAEDTFPDFGTVIAEASVPITLNLVIPEPAGFVLASCALFGLYRPRGW